VHSYQEDSRLGGWVNQQRARRTKLKPEQRAKLDAIGFQWSVKARNKNWNEMIACLERFKHKYGHVHLHRSLSGVIFPPKYTKLINFCHEQRRSHQNKKLSTSRAQELLDLGFDFGDWETSGSQKLWTYYFGRLQDFYDTYGHILVPLVDAKSKRNPLGYWLAQQRRKYHRQQKEQHQTETDSLSTERIEMLNKLDPSWIKAAGDDHLNHDYELVVPADGSYTDADMQDPIVAKGDLFMAGVEDVASEATVSDDDGQRHTTKKAATVPRPTAMGEDASARVLSISSNKIPKMASFAKPPSKKRKKKRHSTTGKTSAIVSTVQVPKNYDSTRTDDKVGSVLGPLAEKLCRLLTKEKNSSGDDDEDDDGVLQHVKQYEERIQIMIDEAQEQINKQNPNTPVTASKDNYMKNIDANDQETKSASILHPDSKIEDKMIKVKLEP